MSARTIGKLAASILICQAVGLLGALFTKPAIPSWYASLQKPWFSPPNWLFAPVWTSLYVMMGVAAFVVWHHGLRSKKIKVALGLFALQLALNALWSPVFFGLQSPLTGLVVIVLLWIALVLTIISFFRASFAAGMLLVPYIAWVTFAGLLNVSLWILNRC